VTGQDIQQVDYKAVRGFEETKEATLNIAGKEIRIAVCNTLGSAMKMMDRVRAGTADYHFIEVMACPGGCIGGGGQPIPTSKAIKKKRMEAIYSIDSNSKIRKSHENPEIKILYDTWMGKPLGEKAHRLLHTHYSPQNR
jgi:NADH-quinone oxidoreductase subunit G/NADP-reducing hydrogenase subunit HndD